DRARLAPIRTEAASGAQCERARSGDRSVRRFAGDRSVRSGAAADVGAMTRSRRSRGQAMVETALVLPMLLLLVFGTINLPSVSDVQTRVDNFASASGITLNPWDVNVNQAVDQTAGGLTVSFSE